MNFEAARDYTLEFWTQPESTPFPADVQDKLLSSYIADFRRLGAMSVVYNGLLALDTAYIDAADEILRNTCIDRAPTSDAMLVTRDICYMDLFRGIINPKFRGYFGEKPSAALRALVNARDKLVGGARYNAGEAAGILSEALVILLLNEAGFETIPSFPWQDQPYGANKLDYNPSFDACVLTDGVTKPKVQIKSSLSMPPSGASDELRSFWNELDPALKTEIIVNSYEPDIAVIILETNLGIRPDNLLSHTRGVVSKQKHLWQEWKLRAMDTVTQAVW